MSYHQLITATLQTNGHLGHYQPRQIEAWMRAENGGLDGLSPYEFDAAVEAARLCVNEADSTMTESLCASYGL